jgi:hypothetical protein
MSMLTINVDKSGFEPVSFMSGTVEESSNFSSLQLDSRNELHVDCFGVIRINSVGVKKWILFFDSMKEKNIKVFFYRLPPVLIEQADMIKNFLCGATVVNAVIPFLCEQCGHINGLIKERKDVYGVNLDHVMWLCEKCNTSNLVFDDDPEEYLRFWKE